MVWHGCDNSEKINKIFWSIILIPLLFDHQDTKHSWGMKALSMTAAGTFGAASFQESWNRLDGVPWPASCWCHQKVRVPTGCSKTWTKWRQWDSWCIHAVCSNTLGLITMMVYFVIYFILAHRCEAKHPRLERLSDEEACGGGHFACRLLPEGKSDYGFLITRLINDSLLLMQVRYVMN